jgi:hypothetical protein
MSRLALVFFTTLLFASAVEAQPPDGSKEGRLARSASALDVHLISAPISGAAQKPFRERSPFGQAATLVTKLVDSEVPPAGGAQRDTGLIVKPWFGGRNAVGVKVELTW